MKHLSLLLALCLLLGCLAGCGTDPVPTEPAGTNAAPPTAGAGTAEPTTPTADIAFAQTDDTMFTELDFRTQSYEGRVVNVSLNGDSAAADSDAVRINGSTLILTEEATYIFTGTLNNGMIVVNCEKSAVPQLIFNGVTVYSETSAPLYVMQAGKVILTLAEGTENYLTNGGSFVPVDTEEIDAALYSRRDLVINGTGMLTVTSPAGKGISGKDDLVITGGTLDIQSAFHGIDANDSLRITGAAATLAAGMDGIHCENNTDTDFGYIYISSGTFRIDSAGDGIAAGAWLQINGGSFDLLAGGGHENGRQHSSGGWGGFPGGGPGGKTTDSTASTDSTSMKGLKAAAGLLLNGGAFTIDSADDALHSDGALAVNGGTCAIATGDDALHAETNLTLSGGDIAVSTSYEGLEAEHILVSGGNVRIVATDDGINAAGGNDQSGEGGRDEMFPGNQPPAGGGHGGPGGPGGMGSGNGSVTISGGTLYINSSGDGIDANGTITISGGHTTIVGPTQGDTATLDYDKSCVITGGTFIGTGARGMAQSFSSSAQGVIALQVGNAPAGTRVTLADSQGTVLIDCAPELDFAVVILSCPEMVSGQPYTITVGTASGTFEAN